MSILNQIRACDTTKPYIFISYSSLDRDLVWQDVLEFQRMGYNVWLDERNLDKTKASWEDDALKAIESYYCKLLVFYISKWSMTSENCYNELKHTKERNTVAIHNGEVGYIAIEVESIGNIVEFKDKVHTEMMESDAEPIHVRQSRSIVLLDFVENFFLTNNKKVRIHPKDEENRKMDYYEEVMASFPDSTKTGHADFIPEPSVPSVEPAPTQTVETTKERMVLPIKPMSTKGGEELFYAGMKLYVEEKFSEAVKQFMEAAEQGSADAQFFLGNCSDEGKGVEKDHAQAADWFAKAAAQNHAAAQYHLGCHYYFGKGIDRNYSQSEYWFRKAAEQDYAAAQFMLGECYANGHGVEHNPVLAVHWYRKAAVQGHEYAKVLLRSSGEGM